MIDWSGFWGFFTTGIPSVVLYPSMLVMTIAIIIGIAFKGIKNKRKYVLWVLLIEYLFVLVCSTVICRDEITFEFDRLELTPFWTYIAVINHTSGVRVWDIILNVVLFVPFGLLIKLLYPSIKFWKMLLIGTCLSICIETSQYLLYRGAAQIDDVIHNTLGAVLGWALAVVVNGVWSRVNSDSFSKAKSS